MKLVFDIGNSAIKGALFDEDRAVATLIIDAANLESDKNFKMKLHSLDFDKQVHSIGCVSVVPAKTERLADVIESVFKKPLNVLSARSPVPIKVDYQTPDTLGADRLAAAVAAWSMYGATGSGKRQNVLVIDAGTSTTFEVITLDGHYWGGSIGVGPALMGSILNQGTAQLPLVDLVIPTSPIGRSTDEAMRAGILYGYLDSVNGMIGRIRTEISDSVVVVATGGWAEWLAARIPEINVVEPHLVLHGVRVMLEYADKLGRTREV